MPTHLYGPAGSVLTEDNLARMYGVPVRRVEVRSGDETVAAIVPLHGLGRTDPAWVTIRQSIASSKNRSRPSPTAAPRAEIRREISSSPA